MLVTWFEELTGFREAGAAQVRENITMTGEALTSSANGRTMACGRLETPSLAELRQRVQHGGADGGRISVREVVADSQQLHADPANAQSLFQVASQFNLLEMVSPDVTPEEGVGIYEYDRTQGPACAIAAGGGTIYRNYFAPVNGLVGQSRDNQIDCLADIGARLGNSGGRLWNMRNGYALASREGLVDIDRQLALAAQALLDDIRALLRIGVQWDTEVTLKGCGHRVSQAFCSALPVAYCRHPNGMWESFARLILEAAYEATLCVAILNWRATGSKRVFLTLLGGGAFGNETSWILGSLESALNRYREVGLDVVIVSYGRSKPEARKLVERFAAP